MTLREEMPPKDNITFCNINTNAHEEISYAVKMFLQEGGKITVVPPGFGKDTLPFNKVADNQKQAEIQECFANQKNISLTVKKEICEAENKARRLARCKPSLHPEYRARSGNMNIHEVASGGHVVTIKSMHIGTYSTREQAIIARDVEREKMGLPKAEY